MTAVVGVVITGLVMLAPADAPQKTRLLVTPLQARGVSPDTAEVMTRLLVSEIKQRGTHTVIAVQDVASVLSVEQQRQLLDCQGNSCAAELAGALDVDELVTGTVTAVGHLYVVALSRVRMHDAVTLAAVTAQRQGDSEAVLPAMVPELTARLMVAEPAEPQTAALQPAPVDGAVAPPLTVDPPARPKALRPRPRAKQRKESAAKAPALSSVDGGPPEGDPASNVRSQAGRGLMVAAAGGAILGVSLLVLAAGAGATVVNLALVTPYMSTAGRSLGVPLTLTFVAAQMVWPPAIFLAVLGLPPTLALLALGVVLTR